VLKGRACFEIGKRCTCTFNGVGGFGMGGCEEAKRNRKGFSGHFAGGDYLTGFEDDGGCSAREDLWLCGDGVFYKGG
jgi:hypothetical protein